MASPLRGVVQLLALVLASQTLAGCSPENAEARRLDSACEGGDATACAALGTRLEQGRYVLRDEKRAQELYTRACDSKVGDGCARLGDQYLNAVEMKKPDSARAAALFAQGCAQGGMLGCTRLGTLHVLGRVQPLDTARAASLYDKACAGKELEGCARLGHLIVHGAGGRPADTATARQHFKASCDADVQVGCLGIARLTLADSATPGSDTLGIALYSKACQIKEESRDPQACYELARAYEAGYRTKQDYQAASRYYRRGCLVGQGEACARLAEMHEKGIGVWRDEETAKEYRERACKAGHAASCPKPKQKSS